MTRSFVSTDPGPRSLADLLTYDAILVAFSGGKDSVACLLFLLEMGVPPSHIELHHHDVDGAGPPFVDWPCERHFSRAVARALGVPLLLSWKEGGFLREMLRDGTPTAPIRFERPGGRLGTVGGNGPAGTRLRFPQVSADLRQRWYSSYTKIDVMAALIRAQDRFANRRTLVVTGERAAESRARARYATFEPHRTDTRDGTRRPRLVDHWRPIHTLDEAAIWGMLRRHGVVPAPAYRLGWSGAGQRRRLPRPEGHARPDPACTRARPAQGAVGTAHARQGRHRALTTSPDLRRTRS